MNLKLPVKPKAGHTTELLVVVTRPVLPVKPKTNLHAEALVVAVRLASPLIVVALMWSVASADEPGTLADSNGEVFGWGRPFDGQTTVPVGSYTTIAAGGHHSLAIRTDGTLAGWGRNVSGQATIPGGVFTEIAAGAAHSLGIQADGTLIGWGSNEQGEISVPGGTFSAVSAGLAYGLGLRSDGTLAAWGTNSFGETTIPMGTFSQIAAGSYHGLAMRPDGTVVGWGHNLYGQTEPPDGEFIAITAGDFHSLGLRTDGTLAGWGKSDLGQTIVPQGTFSAVAAGGEFGLAIHSDGTLAAWGWNDGFVVTGAPNGIFTSVAAGDSQHALAMYARTIYDGDLLISGSGLTANLNRSISVAGDVTVETTTNFYNDPVADIAAGDLILNSGAAFTGNGTINAGGMDVSGSTAINPGQSFTVSSGGTNIGSTGRLDVVGGTLNTDTLVGSGMFNFNSGTLGITGIGGLTLDGSGPFGAAFTLGSGRTLNVSNTTNVSPASQLAVGGGTFNTGTLDLGGTLTFNSGVIQSSGISVRSTAALHIPGGGQNTLEIGAGGITIDSGATSATIGSSIDLTAPQLWTNNSSGMLTFNGEISNGSNDLTVTGPGDTTINGRIGIDFGGGGLIKNGSGTLTLNNASNTYQGGTTINSGTLSIGDGPGDHENLGRDSAPLAIGAGTLRTGKGFFSRVRPVTLNSSSSTIEVPAVPGSVFAEFRGNFTGPGSLNKIGGGTLILRGSNNFSGGMTINAGSVWMFSPAALPTSGDILVNSGAALQLNADQPGTFSFGAPGQLLTLNGGFFSLNTNRIPNTFIWNGNVLLAADSTISGVSGHDNIIAQINGAISGPGKLILGGNIILQGNNTYTGGTTVPQFSQVIIDDDARLGAGDLTLGGVLKSSANILSSRPITLTPRNPCCSHQGATIDTNGFSVTLNGTLTGSGSLTKYGAGTLTLAAANTYSGGTRIYEGRLAVNGSIQGAVTVEPLGILAGSGTIDGNVTSSGRLAPGNSPGIINIDGDYLQTSSGTLEIEVGGLVAGTQHDKLVITGTAMLDGRLEVPIINGFVPSVGDEVAFLTADGGVSGTFNSTFFSGLPATIAHELEYNSNDVRLKFVTPEPILFVSSDPVATWSSSATWEVDGMPAVPESENTIRIENIAGVPQRVDVTASSEIVHSLLVGDDATDVAVRVDGVNLSVAAGTVIDDHGAIELAGSGALVSQTIDVQTGGLLAGNGTLKTDILIVSGGTLRPGFSVGHLDVEGDYQQGTDGTLLVDVENTSQFDTLDVSGSVQLAGTLRIDASNLTNVIGGTVFPILTAASVDGEFDELETIGTNLIYFTAQYSEDGAGAVTNLRGDMNYDDVISQEDFRLFVLGLMDPSRYFDECNCDDYGQARGDFSLNGRLDFDDIAAFQEALNGLGMSSAGLRAAFADYFNHVPEPSSCMLLVFGTLVVGFTCRRPVDRNRWSIRNLAPIAGK